MYNFISYIYSLIFKKKLLIKPFSFFLFFLQTKLNKLVEGRANLEASSESIKSKLERTKLQLDGAQSKNLDLERSNDELKRTNSDLTRQLVKWQSLETKEGEAADTE